MDVTFQYGWQNSGNQMLTLGKEWEDPPIYSIFLISFSLSLAETGYWKIGESSLQFGFVPLRSLGPCSQDSPLNPVKISSMGTH